MNKRIATGIVAGLAVATIGFASASVLNLDGSTIQQSDLSSVTSQTGTVQTNWGYERDDNSVAFVRFSAFETAAYGNTAFVTVRDNNGVEIADKSFVVNGTSANDRITLPAGTLAQNIGTVEVALVG